jgi:diguanylate cyclase (GGDEF)-like protein
MGADLSRAPGSSTQQLAEFVAALSGLASAPEAAQAAVARATEALAGSFGAVVLNRRVAVSAGFRPGAEPGQLVLLAGLEPGDVVELPEVPVPCCVATAPVEGGVEGTLLVGRDAREPFSAEELGLVRAMGRVLAMVLRTIATVDELEERHELLQRLSQIQRSITQRADLQDTLDAIVAGAAALVDEPIASLRIIDPDDAQQVIMVSSLGVPDEITEASRRSRVGEGAGGRAISEARLVVIDDYCAAEHGLPNFARYAIQTAMAAPVREQGGIAGSLTVATRTPGRRFSSLEQEMLLSFAEHASLALTDARMVSDAMHQAMHDSLTGLPNRALFLDRVQHALDRNRRAGRQLAVLFLDLDNFKVVNDSLGHAAGDDLLVAVAGRLSHALRRSDTVARFGGDEFGILVEDVRSEHDAIVVAEQIAGLFVQPFALGDRDHFVTASIGIAIADRTTASPDTLIRDSDAAMYRAKAQGRAGYELFDDLMRARVVHRLRVETELRTALQRGQIRLAYQPVVSLCDGSICGAEALVRWQHPERGLIGPGDFIHVAEESGLIVGLGEQVLEMACEEAARWAQARPDGPQLSISVNLSVRQVSQPGLVGAVRRALGRARLEAPLLALEITESVLLEDADGPKETLRALKALGTKLILDDFGTGYSSLGYLKRLPLDGLKIDRSFVAGLGADHEDSAIVSAVAGMAAGLGLTVTAEGVETAAQAAELRALGIQRAQGFTFARPMSAEEFRRLPVRLGAGALDAA